MHNYPIVFAIVVTYNGTKWIDKCFGSLINSTIPLKILAIDNASTDGTPQIIREKFLKVEVIETGENLGFGKANNIGLKRVLDENADYAFLLNQDAWVEKDTIEKLIAVQSQNQEFHLLSPIHLNGKGDAIDRNFENYLGRNYTPELISDIYLKKIKPFYEGKYANAAAWLLSYHCLETVGGFDPIFKHYGEDDDYINRMHLAELKLGIVPNAIIYHDRPQDGKMGEKFYENQIYTQSVLALKSSLPPNRIYLWRKIISDYFAYYVAYMGKNEYIKNTIKKDILTLKLKRKASKHVAKQNQKGAFL